MTELDCDHINSPISTLHLFENLGSELLTKSSICVFTHSKKANYEANKHSLPEMKTRNLHSCVVLLAAFLDTILGNQSHFKSSSYSLIALIASPQTLKLS